jgi:hypothetical protein
MVDDITRFNPARRFNSDWRDSWEGLRECDWHRDQLSAQGVCSFSQTNPSSSTTQRSCSSHSTPMAT